MAIFEPKQSNNTCDVACLKSGLIEGLSSRWPILRLSFSLFWWGWARCIIFMWRKCCWIPPTFHFPTALFVAFVVRNSTKSATIFSFGGCWAATSTTCIAKIVTKKWSFILSMSLWYWFICLIVWYLMRGAPSHSWGVLSVTVEKSRYSYVTHVYHISTLALTGRSRSLLRDKRIAELKNRIDRSRKIRSAKPNGHIVERSHRSRRSTDTKLLGQ